MSEQIDANLPAETSSAFADALAAHDDKQTETSAQNHESEKEEVIPQNKGKVTRSKVVQDKAPESSAGTLKTVNSEQSPGENQENVPWNNDPRFNKWLEDKKNFQTEKEKFESEKKTLSSKAEQGEVWVKAMQEHPKFAEKVIAVINELTGNSPGGSTETKSEPITQDALSIELEKVAEKLLTTSQFKALKDKLDKADQTLAERAKSDENKAKEDRKLAGDTLTTKYKTDLQSLLGDVKVHPDLLPTLETNIWNRLVKDDLQSIQNIKYSEKFQEIAQQEIDKYKMIVNSINSEYTKNALKNTVPKTMKAGSAPSTKPGVTEKQVEQDFINALKSLPKS